MKKTKIFLIITSFYVYLFIQGCNNTGYEIEESTSSDAQTKNEQSAGIQPKKPTAENLPDAPHRTDNQKSETTNTIENKLYTIQIGAYSTEDRAAQIGKEASLQTGLAVSYFKVSGLCKIRIGSFSSSEEAAQFLEKVRSAGYKDSFITVQSKQN